MVRRCSTMVPASSWLEQWWCWRITVVSSVVMLVLSVDTVTAFGIVSPTMIMTAASSVPLSLAFPLVKVAVVTTVVAPIVVLVTTLTLLQAMHTSLGIEAPAPEQLEEEKEDAKRHALFRHFPSLQQKLAWRALEHFPTPIHEVTCEALSLEELAKAASDTANSAPSTANSSNSRSTTVRFYVKREDLASPVYGGNKVRTLQHQLAMIEARVQRCSRCEKNNSNHSNSSNTTSREIVVVGSGGSNQVVATAVHAPRSGNANVSVVPLWMKDPPDLDNALNMLSTLSLLPHQQEQYYTWGTPGRLWRTLLSKVDLFGDRRSNSSSSVILPLGGNNPAGVLGQASGALELADQVATGIIPDCDGIYLAVGSSCTLSGLILGVALARTVGLSAFARPGFRLHPVLIHGTFAWLHRAIDLYQSFKLSRYIPLTVRHSLYATCGQLKALGGPDVLDECLAILEDETVFHDDVALTGEYGIHSDMSRACARLFDATARVVEVRPLVEDIPPLTAQPKHQASCDDLWLCGHFTAKPMAALCHDLCRDDEHSKDKTMIFWQTKSLTQPRGKEDEWARLQSMPIAVQEWAQQGTAESVKRPGKIDLQHGSSEDYRGLMKKVD